MTRLASSGLGLGLFATVCGAVPAFAQTTELAMTLPPTSEAVPLPMGLSHAEVLDGWQTKSGTRMAAIRITLDAGWKTYWRHPGDAGIPPSFNFKASSNLKDVKIYWPRPQVFMESGTRSIGYKDQMILPIELMPEDASQPIQLEADLDLGICHDICIPVSLDLAADLEGKGAQDAVITQALAAQPKKVPSTARCTIAPIRDGVRVTAQLPSDAAPDQVALFELPSQPVWVSDSQMSHQGNTLSATADLVPPNSEPFDLDPKDLRITVLDKTHAYEMDGCARM
ncbi:protein-disulfide reductase DsbD domain-containing protein [Thioclava kandeliae]|uniref:Protein-disulfide reductase DsbD domain-containing protein n=1 Tax=Thioclava kandeliae TaxID=3070818 RepID=A0ABV1SCT9_9RHOB